MLIRSKGLTRIEDISAKRLWYSLFVIGMKTNHCSRWHWIYCTACRICCYRIIFCMFQSKSLIGEHSVGFSPPSLMRETLIDTWEEPVDSQKADTPVVDTSRRSTTTSVVYPLVNTASCKLNCSIFVNINIGCFHKLDQINTHFPQSHLFVYVLCVPIQLALYQPWVIETSTSRQLMIAILQLNAYFTSDLSIWMRNIWISHGHANRCRRNTWHCSYDSSASTTVVNFCLMSSLFHFLRVVALLCSSRVCVMRCFLSF